MKKKMMALALTVAMTGSLAACGGGGSATTTAASADTTAAEAVTEAPAGGEEKPTEASGGSGLVYWSMWEATEPQGQAIQEAVKKFTEDTGIAVDLQFKGHLMLVRILIYLMKILTV